MEKLRTSGNGKFEFEEIMQVSVLYALIAYLFIGRFMFSDATYADLILGAFIGYLAKPDKKGDEGSVEVSK